MPVYWSIYGKRLINLKADLWTLGRLLYVMLDGLPYRPIELKTVPVSTQYPLGVAKTHNPRVFTVFGYFRELCRQPGPDDLPDHFPAGARELAKKVPKDFTHFNFFLLF
jgi:hypothetical protein